MGEVNVGPSFRAISGLRPPRRDGPDPPSLNRRPRPAVGSGMSRVRSHDRSARLAPVIAAVVSAAAVSATMSAPARAEDPPKPATPYCAKVRARSSADAALLFAPTASVQGIKFPENRTTDAGAVVGAGFQLRTALSISPLDIYKGTQVKDAGEADCRQHEAREAALEALAAGADVARLPALKRAVAFLDGRAEERAQIVAKTDERLAAQAITLVDATEVQKRVSAILRRRAELAGEARRLEAKLPPSPGQASLAALVAKAEGASMTYERQVSHVRSLEPWNVQVMGGLIPQERPVDYFGMVTVGFNFGAFSRNANESRYLDARAEELARARGEVADRARLFRKDVVEVRRAIREQLTATDDETRRLVEGKATLERSPAPQALHTLAVLTLEQQSVEGERVLLESLSQELARMEEKNDGK